MANIWKTNDSVEPFDDGTAETIANQQMYGVIRGCAVTLDAADMTWDIAAGDVMHDGIPTAVAAQTNVTTVTADGSNGRWVLMRVKPGAPSASVCGVSQPQWGDSCSSTLPPSATPSGPAS